MSFDGSRRTLAQQHSRNLAALAASTKALKQLDLMRKGLTHLAGKQDVVTMEDIVGEAGKLAAHGIDPIALAGILADAPQEGGGEALASWVAGHAQTAEQAEGQMQQQHAALQHQMGMSAIHLLMAHDNAKHMMGGISPPMGQVPDAGNALNPADHPENDQSNGPGNSLALRS
jgi:hypothetical protein